MRILLLLLSAFFAMHLYSQDNPAAYLSTDSSNVVITDTDILLNNENSWTIGFWIKPDKPGVIFGINNSEENALQNDSIIASKIRLELEDNGDISIYNTWDSNPQSARVKTDIQYGLWNFITVSMRSNGILLISANMQSPSLLPATISSAISSDSQVVFGALPKGKLINGTTDEYLPGIIGAVDQINIYPTSDVLLSTQLQFPVVFFTITPYFMFDIDFYLGLINGEYTVKDDIILRHSFSSSSANIDMSNAELLDSDCFEVESMPREQYSYNEFLSYASPQSKSRFTNFSMNQEFNKNSFALINKRSSSFNSFEDVSGLGLIKSLSKFDTLNIFSDNLSKIHASFDVSEWGRWDNFPFIDSVAAILLDENNNIDRVIFTENQNGKFYFDLPLSSDNTTMMLGSVSDKFNLTSDNGFGPFSATYAKTNTYSVNDAGGFDAISLKTYDYINQVTLDSVYSDNPSAGISLSHDISDISLRTSVIATATSNATPGVQFIVEKQIMLDPLKLEVISARDFQPYRLGTEGINDTITLDSIAPNTNRIVMELVDANGIRLDSTESTEKIITGNNLETAEWILDLNSLPLVLGSQVKVTLFQENGITNGESKSVSLNIQPYELRFTGNNESWRYYTNDFDRVVNSNEPWAIFPQNNQAVDISKLPPRTKRIQVELLKADTIVYSDTLYPSKTALPYDSATLSFDASTIPVGTSKMIARVFAEGGPKQGLEVAQIVEFLPNSPRLTLDPPNFDRRPNNPVDTNQKKVTLVDFAVQPSFENCQNVRLRFLTGANIPLIDTTLTVNNSSGFPEAKVKLDIANMNPDTRFVNAQAVDPNGMILSDTTITLDLLTPYPDLTTLVPFEPKYTDIPDTIYYYQGQNLYEFFDFAGLPSKTTKVELDFERNGSTIESFSDSINNAPSQQAMRLHGDGTFVYAEDFNNSGVNIKGFTEFSIMGWIRTLSSNRQFIAGFNEAKDKTLNEYKNYGELLMDENGRIIFRYEGSCGLDSAITENGYNDDQFHYIAGSLTENELKIFVDGALVERVERKPNCEMEDFDFYDLHFGGNPDYADGIVTNTFDGYLTHLQITSGGLEYEDIAKQMYSRSITNQQTEVFLITSEEYLRGAVGGGHTFTDFDDRTFNLSQQNNYSFNKKDILNRIIYPINMGELSEGEYELNLKLYYNDNDKPGNDFKWIVKLQSPWLISEESAVSIESDGGFGYFSSGAKDSIFVTVTSPYFSGKKIIGNLTNYQPMEEAMSSEYMTVEGSTATLGFDIGSANPGATLKIFHEIVAGVNVPPILEFPLLVNPATPPKVKGDFSNIREAIVDSTMQDLRKYTLADLEQAVTTVIVRAVDFADRPVGDTLEITQFDNRSASFSYNVADLRAPHSYFIIEEYVQNAAEPNVISSKVIDVAETRPGWFTSNMIASNIKESGDSITFTMKGYIDKPQVDSYITDVDGSNYDPFSVKPIDPKYYLDAIALRTYNLPSSVPILGGNGFELPFTEIEVDLLYQKKTGRLTIQDSLKITFNDKVFGEVIDTKEYHIADINSLLNLENELILNEYYQYGKQGGTIGPGIFKVISRIAEIIKQYVPSFDDIVQVTPDIWFAYAMSRGQYVNTGVDSVGLWGNIGKLNATGFNNTDSNLNRDITSFSYGQVGLGAVFGLDINLLRGLADAQITLTNRLLLGNIAMNHDLPSPAAKNYTSVADQIFAKATASFCWGLISKTIFGPELIHTFNLTDNQIPNIIPQPVDWPSGLDINDQFMTSDFENGNHSVFDFTSEKSPQPEMDKHGENLAAIWLEQDETTKSAKLMLSHFDATESDFADAVILTENSSGMSNPNISLFENKAYITWMQNRHDATSVPGNADFEYLFSTTDIWYAVFDIENSELLHISPINDDFDSITSGRMEGRPEITALSDDKAIINWLVADTSSTDADIHYVMINSNNGTYPHTQPTMISKTEGIETGHSVKRETGENAVAVWRNSEPDNETSILYTSYWNGDSWSVPAAIMQSGSDLDLNHFSYDMNDGKGLLAISINDYNTENRSKIMVMTWDEVTREWKDSGLIHDIEGSYPDQLEVSLSDNKGVIMFEEHRSDILDASHLGENDLLIVDIDNPTELHHINNSEILSDEPARTWHYDIEFIDDDKMFLLSNDIMHPGNTYEPVFGKVFGNPSNNLILRAFEIDGDFEINNLDEDDVYSGIDEMYPLAQDYIVYPQPAIGNITISNKSEIPFTVSKLYDANGRLILTIDKEVNTDFNIQLDEPSGLYFIEIIQGDNLIRKPVILIGN